ncbi:MAG TPA: undecaprenyl/decaprenyl-phosphate alpha-N-acetylglucosaminyl 1-phosphate transferase [Gammaproteobacteria bacterium]|nr:undecaprenyl/decaprenyl-phosphate alpha-N-acetylglucosaminyl 1-phosphate transferase [Gammaproteobacteria bacterium]
MNTEELSLYLLIVIMSMAICMAIIPVMMRIAPYIGMIDSPDKRKVHTAAIPRSGGVGIVVGTLVPLIIWLDFSRFSTSLIIGCSILLVFGVWDDIRNIRPVLKFIGQIMAAIIVVYYGDIYVFHFPLLGLEELPEYIGRPFTVIAIVGMVNALNLSDGLDGLAGGEALISLAAIAYLAYQFEGGIAIAVAAATIGGIFGFLRFNSHPARIFMGDTGSQTLGFILAVLAVYLTQQVNPLVSPVVALLLLGLPVVDSLVVFYLRAKRGDSLVVAAKDHLHHRLLALGFYHYESVMIIYSIQIILISSAVLFPYESDFLLISIYFGICLLIFSILAYTEKSNWHAHGGVADSSLFLSDVLKKHDGLTILPYRILKAGMSLFIIAAAVMSNDVPIDLGVSSLVLFVFLLVTILSSWFGDNLYRLLMFVTIGFSVYLLSTYPPSWLLEQISLIYVFFVVITLISFITIRVTVKDQFQITPLDYLVVIMAVFVGMVPGIEHGTSSMVWMVVQMIILFYACELVIQNMRSQLNSFTGAAGLALVLIAYRGLI